MSSLKKLVQLTLNVFIMIWIRVGFTVITTFNWIIIFDFNKRNK